MGFKSRVLTRAIKQSRRGNQNGNFPTTAVRSDEWCLFELINLNGHRTTIVNQSTTKHKHRFILFYQQLAEKLADKVGALDILKVI